MSRDTNKIHVIDADVVAGKYSPHAIAKGFKSDRDLVPYDATARGRAEDYYINKSGLSNEFAEEYLEGDLPNLKKS